MPARLSRRFKTTNNLGRHGGRPHSSSNLGSWSNQARKGRAFFMRAIGRNG